MRKISILIFGVFVFFVLIFVGLKIYFRYSDLQEARRNLKFPDNLQNEYYVSIIKIDHPLVTYIGDKYYILTDEALKEYNGCDSTFLKRSDVVLLYYDVYASRRTDKQPYELERGGDVDYMLEPKDTIQNLPVFEFTYPPQDFVFVLTRESKMYFIVEPDVRDYEFGKNYIPSLYPRFSRRDVKEMWDKQDKDIQQILDRLNEED